MEYHKKAIDLGGSLVEVDTLSAGNTDVLVTGKLLRIARTEGDGYEDVENPTWLIHELRRARPHADMFSFVEMIPDGKPQYPYYTEPESVAALPVRSFDYWWREQVSQETRTGVRKAEKKGIRVNIVPYSDDLVRGIQNLYNESPMRQGKPFWHYGRDFETLKKIHATFLDRSDFLGAYFNGELVGFMKLVYGKQCAGTMNILSMIEHRDKRVMNALIAKAVETCDKKGIPYLTYCAWSKGGLGEFKLRNGFTRMDFPRYYVPLTVKGEISLRLKLHRGIRGMLPETLKEQLLNLRSKWYSVKTAASTS
jgi:hypothetical protein